MPTSIPLGAPIWVDANSPDIEADLAFYTGLFGWRTVDYGEDFGGYRDLLLGGSAEEGRAVGGIVPESPEYLGLPSRWTVQFHVADCAEATARAEKLGGTVHIAPTAVADQLVFSMVRDPNGALFGLFEPRNEDVGFKAHDEMHAPSWFEYHYDGVPADAMRFYADLLEWDVRVPPWTDPNDPRPYAALAAKGSDDEFGGCHPAEGPERDLPPEWVVMFFVASTDVTCVTATELGGEIVGPPTDMPMLRIAGIRSPGGSTFGVMSERTEGS